MELPSVRLLPVSVFHLRNYSTDLDKMKHNVRSSHIKTLLENLNQLYVNSGLDKNIYFLKICSWYKKCVRSLKLTYF